MTVNWDHVEPPRSDTRRFGLRVLVAGVVVIACTAGAVATAALLEVKSITDALRQNPQLQLGNTLAHADAGAPQTLLLIGSDRRALSSDAVDRADPPHSDTMLLVRLDPSRPATAMFSVPRDLQVTIYPPHALPTTQKINAAYTLGGDKLAAQTVERVFGIQINHVIDINFGGFQRLVDYLGGVYVQVDRRYYHSNAGLPASLDYSEINVQPGYQRLDGSNALAYVRFRHADTDIVRNARQQDFLRQIKNQLGVQGIISSRQGIERILGAASRTDIRSADDVLRLLELAVQSASHPIRQVVFQGNLGPSYVTATPAQIHAAMHAFLHGSDAPPPPVGRRTGTPVRGAPQTAAAQTADTTPVPAGDLAQARAASARVPFGLLFPRRRDAGGDSSGDMLRTYLLPDRQNRLRHAYVAVFQAAGLGEYYDVQGTDWTDPPILTQPSATEQLDGRTYQLYYEGQHVRLIAWHTRRAVYWIVNSLQDTLSGRELVAIAQSTRPI